MAKVNGTNKCIACIMHVHDSLVSLPHRPPKASQPLEGPTPTRPMHLQERERVRWEEQRKAMQQEAQTKAELARYNDELARKRGEAEHEKQRVRNRELVSMQVCDGCPCRGRGLCAGAVCIGPPCTMGGYAGGVRARKPREFLSATLPSHLTRSHLIATTFFPTDTSLQEESTQRQEEQKQQIAAQIEAERRATERYKVRGVAAVWGWGGGG
jgi:hypothetical protein